MPESPVAPEPAKPSAEPSRGVGPSIFLGLVSLLFAALACFFYWENQTHERIARTAVEQGRLLSQENNRNRAELERLQGAFGELNSQVKSMKGQLSEKVQDQSLAIEQVVRQKQQNEAVQDKIGDTLKKEQQNIARDREELRREKEAWLKVRTASGGAPLGVKPDDRVVSLFSSLVSPADITLGQRGGWPVLRVQTRFLINSADTGLTSKGENFLKQFAQSLEPYLDKYELLVEGHTDSEPVMGGLKKRFATNWELSSYRALLVTHFLTDNRLVPAARVTAAGRADSVPISKEGTKEAAARNRRIELVLVPAGETGKVGK